MRLLILFILTIFSTCARAQFDKIPSPSPEGILTQVIGNTTLHFRYERPSVRGRKIFGGLVPYGEVWRTGAGNCTTIAFDHSVVLGKQPVPAGKYALLTVPGPAEWTVILNTDTTLYGAYKYDPARDVIRFRVPAHLKRRGGMSFVYDKHSYTLHLDRKIPLDFLPLDRDWVLNASYIDKTFVRHKVSYDLFR
ncbi:MAG: DUF2911 domain-containing protein, partial [Bacteroidota bacterium]